VGCGEEADSHHLATLALRAEKRIVTAELLATLSKIPRRWWCRLRHGQQFSAAGQIPGTAAIAEKPVMADALEAVWKDMHQEAPQEFVRGQGHHFLPVLVLIVLISESDVSLFQFFQPVIGDGNPVRVAAQVIQNPFRTAEGRLGINDPLAVAERRQMPGEVLGVR